jgi:hypothetical protein
VDIESWALKETFDGSTTGRVGNSAIPFRK